ncbi:ABC transporter ATP-binding protein [Teredinibacter haidensis]|uniref:ABC transporter ATP-binding protein n=1 Tax=Teredinibacter haidensis TaxID=2731755 RepID=UPI000948D552|nr:ABC transporter ATP-binding protein [Teredinibacter haidensis]
MLKLDQITLAYDKAAVVKNLSFDLKAGETACLIGPSGSGKSTVLRALAGFQPLNSGSITLRGKTVSDSRSTVPPEHRKFSMVFQDYALFPHLTAEENVRFGLRHLSAKAAREKAAEMLELVGLQQNALRYCHQLSGGQQQRVAIARALATEPDLLLLDEPFSNLDAGLRSQLSHELRDILNTRDVTTLMVTHDQSEAFCLADQLGVIMEGQLLQWDTPINVYQQPASQQVANFVGESSYLPGTVIDERRVTTVLGLHPVFHHNKAIGSTVNVLLRPENICFDESSEIRGEIKRKLFRGADSRYTLELDDRSQLTTASANHLEFELGESIGIRLVEQPLKIF